MILNDLHVSISFVFLVIVNFFTTVVNPNYPISSEIKVKICKSQFEMFRSLLKQDQVNDYNMKNEPTIKRGKRKKEK